MKNQWIILGSIFVICFSLSFLTTKEGVQNKKNAKKPPQKNAPKPPQTNSPSPTLKNVSAKVSVNQKGGNMGSPQKPPPKSPQKSPQKPQPKSPQKPPPKSPQKPPPKSPQKPQPKSPQKPPPKSPQNLDMDPPPKPQPKLPKPPPKPQPKKPNKRSLKNVNSVNSNIITTKVGYNKNLPIGKAAEETNKIFNLATMDVNDAINENKQTDINNYIDVVKKYNDQYNKNAIKSPVINENYIKLLELKNKLDTETGEPTSMEENNSTEVVYNRNLIVGKAGNETTRIFNLANNTIDDGMNKNIKVDIRNHIDVIKQYNDQYNKNDNISSPLINSNYIKILELHNKYIETTCNSQETQATTPGTTYPAVYTTSPLDESVSVPAASNESTTNFSEYE